jgi:hypothetical protein
MYPVDYLPVSNHDQARVFDEFVGDLAAYLEVEPEILSIAETWRQAPPTEERDISKYMENVSANSWL